MNSAPSVSGWGFTAPDAGFYNIMKKDEQSAYQKAQDYSTNMSNTAWQRGVQDMKDAGLNPMLAVSQGPASSPQGTKMQIHNPPGMGANFQMQTAAQTELIQATADKERATAENLRGVDRTQKEASAAQLTQEVEKSKAEVKRIIAEIPKVIQDTETSAASARHMDQQVRNLTAAIPQIQQTVKLLRAQTTQTGALTGLSEQQTAEVRQRIKANLPQIQAALQGIETTLKRMQQPQAENKARLHESFIGFLSEYLRAINPLQGLLQ